MAHELSTESGKVEMMYAKSGGTPWHGLGTASDVSTPQAALTTAGMLWMVETTEGYVQIADGYQAVEGYRFIRRTDTGRVLGIGTTRYKPVQNTQCGEIMDAIVSEGRATVETCGALAMGKRCWMLSHLPGTFEVVKGDEVRPYMALVWGHDGLHGIAGKLTPVRIVCKNTMQAAGFGSNGKWSVAADIYFRHSGDISVRIDDARTALGLIHKKTEQTAEAYRAMAGKELSAQEIMAYFATIFPAPAVPDEDTTTEDQETYDTKKATWNERMMDLAQELETGPGNEFARGSVWNAYNAITHWTDHVYPVLKSGAVSASRQESVLFGGYAETKTRALTAALALV